MFSVVTGEKVGSTAIKKSKLQLDQIPENVQNQQSKMMNAVIDEFKSKSHLNLAEDASFDNFNEDATSQDDQPSSQFNELSLLTRDPYFPTSLKLIEFPHKESFLFGAKPPPLPRDDERLRDIIRTVDFTRITNRIILGGLFWDKSSSKRQRRCNLEDSATFLKKRFKDNFMIWNLGCKI